MSQFYDDLKESFGDILNYRKSKITLRSETIELYPNEPKSRHSDKAGAADLKPRSGAEIVQLE
ncbi:MAG: hypothetical protein RL235_766 [Chlamydiota bacterium]|jgi:hypothetical protein